MKKLKYILLIFGLMACSDLEEEVFSEISPSNFYSNVTEANVAVTSVYNSFNRTVGLYDFGMSSMVSCPSPKLQGRVPWRRIWANYTTSSNDGLSLPRVWNSFYQGVFRGNTVISELEGRTFEEDDNKRIEYIAEIQFLRAWSYFNLVQLFGAVPLPLAPAVTIEDAQLPRTPIAEVYAQIIADLEAAEANLPADKRPESEIGRPIKATATFLLAKVYLTMAGLPLQDNSKMSMAQAKIQEVISLEGSDQGYQLIDSYEDAIRVDNNAGRIFAIQQTQAVPNQGTAFSHVWGAQQRFGGGLGQFHFGFTEDFYFEFEDTDERRDVTMLSSYTNINGVFKDYFGTAEEGDGSSWNLRHGLFQNKYVDFDQACCDGDPDMIIYRYADALLMAAEIENNLNGPTGAAYGYLNRVRLRANATEAPAGMSQEEFAEYVYEERYKELSLEFQELYDIRRLGKVEEVLAIHPENITWQPANTPYNPNFDLWPLPFTEINANPNLEQNPGW